MKQRLSVWRRKATPAGQNLEAIAVMAYRVTMKVIKIKMVATLMVLMIPAGHSCQSSTWWSWQVHMPKTWKNLTALKILPQKQIGQPIQKLQKTR
jgi:hypothetical protein